MSHLLSLKRLRRNRSDESLDGFAGHVYSDLTDGLPDEDLLEDLTESLDMYVMGSKPRCEESEYLELVGEAIDRMALGE